MTAIENDKRTYGRGPRTRRRRRAAKAALVPAVAIGALAITGTAASTRDADRGQEKTERIVLVAKGDQLTTQQKLDLGDRGLSQGDRFVFSDTLFRAGKPIGSDGGECSVVSNARGRAATYQCLLTLNLPGGQITAQGLFSEDEAGNRQRDVRFAVTGGTRRYRSARGELLDETVGESSFRYTLSLTTDGR